MHKFDSYLFINKMVYNISKLLCCNIQNILFDSDKTETQLFLQGSLQCSIIVRAFIVADISDRLDRWSLYVESVSALIGSHLCCSTKSLVLSYKW